MFVNIICLKGRRKQWIMLDWVVFICFLLHKPTQELTDLLINLPTYTDLNYFRTKCHQVRLLGQFIIILSLKCFEETSNIFPSLWNKIFLLNNLTGLAWPERDLTKCLFSPTIMCNLGPAPRTASSASLDRSDWTNNENISSAGHWAPANDRVGASPWRSLEMIPVPQCQLFIYIFGR